MNISKFLHSLILVCVGVTLSAQGISFEKSTWKEALDKAKAENKLLFVDAYAEWCGPCKRMAKYEFTNEEVGKFYNSNFVNLKLDMESDDGRTFDSQYPVSAYPTMFFLDGDGKVVKKVKGGRKAKQLIAMATLAMKSHDFSGEYRQKYEEGDRTYATVYNYIKALRKSSKPTIKIANEYLRSKPEISEDQRLQLIAVAATEADSKLFDEMLSNRNEIAEVIGTELYDSYVMRACDKTIQKAIEYEYPELLTEAITKAKQGLHEHTEAYVHKSHLTYAKEMHDAELYSKSVIALAKMFQETNNASIEDLVAKSADNKMLSKGAVKKLSKYAYGYHKQNNNEASASTYARVLLVQKEYDKGIKMLNKTIKSLNKEGKSIGQLDRVIKLFEEKKALK